MVLYYTRLKKIFISSGLVVKWLVVITFMFDSGMMAMVSPAMVAGRRSLFRGVSTKEIHDR